MGLMGVSRRIGPRHGVLGSHLVASAEGQRPKLDRNSIQNNRTKAFTTEVMRGDPCSGSPLDEPLWQCSKGRSTLFVPAAANFHGPEGLLSPLSWDLRSRSRSCKAVLYIERQMNDVLAIMNVK